ncbi:MAG: MgtC/SapB family protein [Chloroflexi bacterium]|nr:MAG: MgtC/SapB family protein [Chloroflexota bacterium]
MPPDVSLQFELAIRLLVAAVLGAAIGFEREIHAHPAGMRTHLLVSEGSAIFTVLSIYGFVGVLPSGEGSPPDPTRIAAQIVSGIGFLGAGAILKSGTSIRGLTTAASLWATAAVGVAVGAGEYAVGAVGTAIVLFSLWPLNRVADRIRAVGRSDSVRMRLQVASLESLGSITRQLSSQRIETSGLATSRAGAAYEVEMELKVRSGSGLAGAVEAISKLEGVEVMETSPPD